MRYGWKRLVTLGLIEALGLAALAAAVMGLWNVLMPSLFAWHAIAYWQALALLILARILFGGLHGWHGRHAVRRVRGRWRGPYFRSGRFFYGRLRPVMIEVHQQRRGGRGWHGHRG